MLNRWPVMPVCINIYYLYRLYFLLKKLVCFKIITSFVQVKTVKLH